MKTNRVHKKVSAVRTKSQAKTPSEKTVQLIFNSPEDGKEMFRVKIPTILYTRVLRACKKMKITPGQFFERVIRRDIAAKSRTLHSTALAGGVL
jgi:hypothetical protein